MSHLRLLVFHDKKCFLKTRAVKNSNCLYMKTNTSSEGMILPYDWKIMKSAKIKPLRKNTGNGRSENPPAT